MKWRLLNTGFGNAYFNMALDETIFSYRKKNLISSTIRFYGWDGPAITLGYFQRLGALQNSFKEVNLPFIRRITGGGAVLHCCEVTFSLVCKYSEVSNKGISESYRKISRAIVSGLKELGLETYISDSGSVKTQLCFSSAQPGDVVIRGKKLAGGAQRRSLGVLLHQGSILLEQNRNFAKFYTGGVSLDESTGRKIMFDEIEECILNGFRKEFGIALVEGQLTEQEMILTDKLIEKYKSPEWNNRF